MQFRLNFDDKIFKAFIRKVIDRANGGSPNKALKNMIVEWNALDDARSMSNLGQNVGSIMQNQPNSEGDLSAALDDLEAAFGE